MSPLFDLQKSDPNASYTCTSCQKVCVNWRAYVYHQRSRHSETDGKNFSCNICGRQFYTRHRLKKHMLGHDRGKHHCCHVCGKLFESNKKLTIHSLVHNLSSMHHQDLQCADCGRKYTDWVPFKQHMKTHGAEGVCYPCETCKETFPTQYELEKHKRIHKQFQCEFCNRFFRSASVLSVHLRVHTGERPYKCGLCGRDFSQSCVLKVHMRTHVKEGKYECKLCGLVFVDVMEYFKHHMAHLEEGNLQCEECGKLFDDINNKNRHMATHRDRDGRQCHVCGKEFGRVSHLEAHMLSHSDSDPMPLMCKVCGEVFSSQDLLTAHYSTHLTGDLSSSDTVLSAPDGVPLFCGVCGKMFKDRKCLRKHMKKHDKEAQKSIKIEKFIDEDVVKVENGQFSCIDCGKKFGKADHLVVHRREHTGECPHSCCMCGQSFMLRTQLLQHIREHRQSGVMMYLNLNDGEVCATMSDIKDVLKLSSVDDSDSGTEADINHCEEGMRSKVPSNHSEALHQPQQAESQSNKEHHLKSDQNLLVQVKPDIVKQKYPHQDQNPQSQQLLQKQHQYQHPHPSFVTSDLISSEPSSLSISSSNNVTTSRDVNSHHLQPSPLKAHELTLTPSTLDSRRHFTEAMSPTPSMSVSPGHSANSSRDNLATGNDKACLYSSRNPSKTSTANNLIFSSTQFPLSNNKTLLQPDNNFEMLREGPQMPIAMHISPDHENLKPGACHPLSYPRGYVVPPGISHLTPLHHLPSIPSYVHGQSSRISSDVHHTLSNFQLLPQTAFPENSHL